MFIVEQAFFSMFAINKEFFAALWDYSYNGGVGPDSSAMSFFAF